MKTRWFFLVLCFVFLISTTTTASSLGLWVVRDGLTTKAGIDELLATAARLGVDTLFLQVNGRAEAYYRSQLVPPAPGLEEDFDPLAYAIEGATRYNIAIHPWINAYTISSFVYRPQDPRHILHTHPHWVMVDAQGRSQLDYGPADVGPHLPAIMLEPGLPEVQDYLCQVVEEILNNYDVDGIHLDYLRYPSADYGYSPYNRRVFQERYGVDPLHLVQNPGKYPNYTELMDRWDDYRRWGVTQLVKRLAQLIDQCRPEVRLSAAVYGDVDDAYSKRFQDWPTWLAEGYLDFAVPMLYSANTLLVAHQMETLVERVEGPLHIGLGAYALLDDPSSLEEKIRRAQRLPVEGIVLFSYNAIKGHQGILEIIGSI
ncbi:MAG: glycoside hydrolase family 10 protein [Limnochordia bacterium]|jgi:uncharacterized lipoprotein YddW (UPF0748 family)